MDLLHNISVSSCPSLSSSSSIGGAAPLSRCLIRCDGWRAVRLAVKPSSLLSLIGGARWSARQRRRHRLEEHGGRQRRRHRLEEFRTWPEGCCEVEPGRSGARNLRGWVIVSVLVLWPPQCGGRLYRRGIVLEVRCGGLSVEGSRRIEGSSTGQMSVTAVLGAYECVDRVRIGSRHPQSNRHSVERDRDLTAPLTL